MKAKQTKNKPRHIGPSGLESASVTTEGQLHLIEPPENCPAHDDLPPRPILKWAGGKTQLLPDLEARLPSEIHAGESFQYVEPLVGGGALFFHLRTRYRMHDAVLCDINPDLIECYQTVQEDLDQLIPILANLEERYLVANEAQRKDFFYGARAEYNECRARRDLSSDPQDRYRRTALTIFLNRTCFNGLYRVNRKGGFNVPHGRNKNPKILDKRRLTAASRALTGVRLICGDFTDVAALIEAPTFLYFDPPFRPLSATSSFTSYSDRMFSDDDQRRLAKFFASQHASNVWAMLSNSDPTNTDASDGFFDDLYHGHQIDRVPAKRIINSNADRRGEIRELIITNYRHLKARA